MELKPGYKQTEMGVIPEEWDADHLGNKTTKVGSGITPTGGERVYRQEGRPFLRSQNIGWGNLLLDDIAFIDDATHDTFKATEIKVNDVFLNITGASIGRSALADARVDRGNVNQHVCIIRADQDYLYPRFLNYLLLSKVGQRQIDSFQAGGNRQGLNFGQIRSFLLPIPPLLEQRAIAGTLSDVDALIAKLDALIAKKRDLKQAAMQQLLTGQTRLPGFSGEWEVKRLGDISTLYQPVTISAKLFNESGYPVYGANGVVGFYHDFNHDSWQVTVTCRGSTCGTVNQTVDKCWITGNAMVVNCDQNKDLNKTFLYYSLLNQNLSICITGTGQPQIVRGPLANVELNIPRDLAEQTAISTVLSDMDAELAALEARRDKTRGLKQGMMQELLTGRIRLV